MANDLAYGRHSAGIEAPTSESGLHAVADIYIQSVHGSSSETIYMSCVACVRKLTAKEGERID